MSEPFEPIEIVGVDTPNVSTPRNDGTRGSGLYCVPIKLSRRPPREWAAALPDIRNHPPEFTTMHRPGIASVRGDTVVLDGTTIEEVRDYHARTLRLVVARLNEAQAQHDAKAQIDASREAPEAPPTRRTSAPSRMRSASSSPHQGMDHPRSGIS